MARLYLEGNCQTDWQTSDMDHACIMRFQSGPHASCWGEMSDPKTASHSMSHSLTGMLGLACSTMLVL